MRWSCILYHPGENFLVSWTDRGKSINTLSPDLPETWSWNHKELSDENYSLFSWRKYEEPKQEALNYLLSYINLQCCSINTKNWTAPNAHKSALTILRDVWGFFKVASLVKILLKWLFIQRYFHKYKMSFYNQFPGRHLHSRLFSHQSGYLLKGTIMHIKSHFIISFQVGICTPDCSVISGNHLSDA